MRSLHLLYHELRPAKTSYSYVTPCEEFAAHCALYARLRKRGAGEGLRPEITFDDGHESDATWAMPAMGEFGLRATFFITAGWTGRRAGYMDWQQVRSLVAAGHRIGAHGMQHKLLTGCSAAELDEELAGARARLEDGLGCEIRTMSLPGGRSDGRVLKACYAAGYEQVFTSVPRAEAMEGAPRLVGRANLLGSATVAWLERLLDSSTGVLTSLERADRLKMLAKNVLGDRIYARLWALANREEAQMADVGALGS